MVASASALAAITATGLPTPAQAFLAACAEGEGGDLPNRLYSGGRLVNPADAAQIKTDARGRLWQGDLATFPAWHGATTRGGLISTAAGWLQFTHTTWEALIGQTNAADFAKDHFPNGWRLAQDDFRRRSGRDLLAALNAGQLKLIHTYLYATWTGGCDPNFPKRYANNLAALRASPAPVPAPQLAIEIPAAAVDQLSRGQTVSLMVKAAAATMLIFAFTGGDASSNIADEPAARAPLSYTLAPIPKACYEHRVPVTLRFERDGKGRTIAAWAAVGDMCP